MAASKLAFLPIVLAVACASERKLSPDDDRDPLPDPSSGSRIDGGLGLDDANLGEVGGEPIFAGDPETCAEAAERRTYVGCEFWPTVTQNPVWSVFDFAVVVANAGREAASVEVTGPSGFKTTATVAPDSLTKVFLPWVPVLKGPDFDSCTRPQGRVTTYLAKGSAYRLTSTRPVTVYQFSPLEYATKGGPPGKSWAGCAGDTMCDLYSTDKRESKVGCFSFSNDASLLLPATALTGNVRVVSFFAQGNVQSGAASFASITATRNGTRVKVVNGPKTSLLANTSPRPGDTHEHVLDAGDVLQLATVPHLETDISGTLVTASEPIQVIGGVGCRTIPTRVPACDHLEESMPPAETLGKDYVIAAPTAPTGAPAPQLVRLIGNRDGTHLTWSPAKPPGAPDTLSAGQVAEIPELAGDVRVTADHEFLLATFLFGGDRVDPSGRRGDPSMSVIASTEQYRRKYVFLAPDDYDQAHAIIVQPLSATLTLDGAPLPPPTALGTTGFGVLRVPLGPGNGGAHRLEASAPVGLQVTGYGAHTSYQYPGGLDLRAIAPPPPVR
jgi:hypothetical protein